MRPLLWQVFWHKVLEEEDIWGDDVENLREIMEEV